MNTTSPNPNPFADPAWVRSLEYHPLAQMFALIDGDEFAMLVEDIRKNGILQLIMLHEGKVLDGRNRHRAGLAADHKFKNCDFARLSLGIDPESYVISANLQRRQLNSKAKRAVIARLIEAKPAESDRQIARFASVDPKTVASVRTELENRALDFIDRLDVLTPSQWQKVITERREKIATMLDRHAPPKPEGAPPRVAA